MVIFCENRTDEGRKPARNSNDNTLVTNSELYRSPEQRLKVPGRNV
jgi:hypothetical protein